jgi:hypothetical protein
VPKKEVPAKAETRALPPAKRAAAAAAGDTAATSKKYKSAMDEMADEWLCPITTELPIDPVMAEDNRMYERSAIEQLIRTQGAALKSPVTNTPMGPRLMPSTQARNTIEKLVRSGAIGGDKAERWLVRLSDEELVNARKQEAEGGCVSSMKLLALWYSSGQHGLTEDLETSFRWAKKGADLKDPPLMALAAFKFLRGRGTAQSVPHGVALMTTAAMKGSKRAASDLGDYYWDGRHGFPQDKAEARHWYAMVATNAKDDVLTRYVHEAAERARAADE